MRSHISKNARITFFHGLSALHEELECETALKMYLEGSGSGDECQENQSGKGPPRGKRSGCTSQRGVEWTPFEPTTDREGKGGFDANERALPISGDVWPPPPHPGGLYLGGTDIRGDDQPSVETRGSLLFFPRIIAYYWHKRGTIMQGCS